MVAFLEVFLQNQATGVDIIPCKKVVLCVGATFKGNTKEVTGVPGFPFKSCNWWVPLISPLLEAQTREMEAPL